MNGITISLYVSLVVKIFMVFNSLGQLPVFAAVLSRYESQRQKKIIFRELIIALVVLMAFIFLGNNLLIALDMTASTISVVGGVLLFLISLDLLFPKEVDRSGVPKHEPMIVPLAIPGLAGPGSMVALMAFTERYGMAVSSTAFLLAWIPSLLLLLSSSLIKRRLGEKGLQALERIGGMILALIGVNMFAIGVVGVVKENFNF